MILASCKSIKRSVTREPSPPLLVSIYGKEEKPNTTSKPILVTICGESIGLYRRLIIKSARPDLRSFKARKWLTKTTEEVDDASQLLRKVAIKENNT